MNNLDDDDDESVKDNENVDSSFKSAVKEWVLIHDQLAALRQSIAAKNKRSKELSKFIIDFMQHQNKEICSLGESGLVQVKSSKRKETINKNYIQTLLIDKLKDANLANTLTDSIFDDRKITETFRLTRSSNII